MAISCDPQSLDAAARCFICIPTGFKPAVNASLLNSISGVNATPQSLIDLSKGFDSFQGVTSLGAEVYLLQQIAGLRSLSPSDLATAARCFDCGRDGDLSDMHTYLLASQAGGSVVPADLMTAARSYQVLFGVEWRVNLYLTCQTALAAGAVSSCDPAALLTASRCLTNCLPYYVLRAVRVYLWCQIILSGGIGGNLIPNGSLYTGAPPTFTITVLANSFYEIAWGANDLSMTMGGITYNSTGPGTAIHVYTGPNTTMTFTGTFAGTTVTLKLKQQQSVFSPGAPGSFTWTLNGAETLATATWAVPPAGATTTELWTSPDGVNFSLAASVANPGTSASVAAPSAGNFLYARVHYCNATVCGVFSSSLSVQASFAQVTNWANRVITNGGAAVSGTTKSAMNGLWSALVTAGIDSKMLTVVCFVPDSLIAALTPLVKTLGNDPWSNTGIPAGNLTVNGLLGDGSHHLDTGLIPSTTWPLNTSPTNAGMTLYNVTSSNAACIDMGALQGGSNLILRISNSSTGEYQCYGSVLGSSMAQAANANWTGFFSGNRTSTTRMDIYKANSVTPFASIANAVGGIQTGTSLPLSVFCFDGDGLSQPSTKRISFAAIHQGLSSSECQAFYNAIQAFRTALGGGFI